MWTAAEVADPVDAASYHPSQGMIAFEGVSFRYPNGRGVSNLSFSVERGRPTFLVGETGLR